MKKHALVTGSTKGIGRAIAQKLLDEGFSVILNYHSDKQTAREVLNDFRSKYGHDIVHCVQADLSVMESIDLLYKETIKVCNKLDVMVLNTGITYRSSFEDMRYDSWQHVMQTNLTVPVFMLQKFISIMQKDSSVLFTGSLMGEKPHAMSLAYGVSKGAVHSLVKNLVKFLQPYSISVNAIAPGFVETEWQKDKPENIKKSIISKVAANRFAKPDEVADLCYSMVMNKYMNGQVIIIDGGYDFK